MIEPILTCNIPGCDYSTTKECMENHGDQCSNIVRVAFATPEIPIEEAELPQNVTTTMRILPDNIEFQEEKLETITREHNCNMVLLIGEPECGKSTLYAALFDQFHKGGCGGYLFAGTKTPIGFERRCHKARRASKNLVSKTERTKNFDFSYLHLAVRHESLQHPIKHLLFADVNGEKFQAARSVDEDMKKLTILKRADHICFVADGEKLLDSGERHNVKDDIISTAKRAVNNMMIDDSKGFNLIVTKWDKIVAAGKADEIEEFLIAPITRQFGSHLKQTLKVASRSQNVQVESGEGVDDFLHLILKDKLYNRTTESYNFDITRQFQKFKYRIYGQ